MDAKPVPGTSTFYDILDRVLDKGIVIDAEVAVMVVGLELARVDARIVVASIETYVEKVDRIAATGPIGWRPRLREDPDVLPPPAPLPSSGLGRTMSRISRYLEKPPEDEPT